ncbi:cysteine proteinase [Cylindrobasidium torrendii FP15055 ss-10]|uniref:Cysteine proteinase n=1 Tax=Cylindrobasidium torrendii FP15055 ss-10 TaxID=1314674 RepID=A0A0D7BHN6_9AGAR|nr:cysteine proteinase [Cylindrobasidium torrendii FP15055 ss-10]
MESSQRLRRKDLAPLSEQAVSFSSASHSITDFRSQVAEGAFEPIQPSRLRRKSDLTVSLPKFCLIIAHYCTPQGTPEHIRRSIETARSTLNGPKPPPVFTPKAEQMRKITRARDVEIDKRLHPKLRPVPSLLPPADEKEVDAILQKNGVISKYEREQVSHTDIRRLLPGTWLNDEIINFYGALMLGRSESNKENDKFPKAHYFSTFFWSKLEKDGYDKGRLAKWTKKFDLFSKDVVLIPVNHNNVHWTAAVINFKRKRIESYDSMGGCRPPVYAMLRHYLDAEHKNKKKKPFDFTDWTDHRVEDLPQQENAYDCGVFTCQFLQCVSRGEEAFNFSQQDIKYLRRRMIWEISHACLRDE